MRLPFVVLLLLVLGVATPAFATDAETHASPVTPTTYAPRPPMHHGMMAPWHHFPKVKTDESAETLFSGPLTHGFYVAPEVKYARITGNDTALVGGRAAWLLNHRVAIGGAGYMMGKRIPAPPEIQAKSTTRRYYSLGYGGLLLGYILAPQKLIHAEVNVLLGGGHVGGMHNRHMRDGYYARVELEPARFFVVEPDIHLEINVAPHLRLGLGGGYRMVTGVNELGLENKDLRGPSASLLLKLGVL